MAAMWRHQAFVDLYGRPFNARHYGETLLSSDGSKGGFIQGMLSSIPGVLQAGLGLNTGASGDSGTMSDLFKALKLISEVAQVSDDDMLKLVGDALQETIKLCAQLPSNTNNPSSLTDFLFGFLPKVGQLSDGDVLCVPCGWGRGDPSGTLQPMLLVISRVDSQFELYVCNTGQGIEYHAVKPNVLDGRLLVQLPLRLRGIPSDKIEDSTFWFMAFRPLVWASPTNGPKPIYEQLLPFLNCRPVNTNGEELALWTEMPNVTSTSNCAQLAMQACPTP